MSEVVATEVDAIIDDFVNPLRRPLQEPEVELLATIWSTVGRPDGPFAQPEWATWDYIRRMFARTSPVRVDAAEVLPGLPSIPKSIDRGARYGLFFASEQGWGLPTPSARVGLTIAGIAALDAARPGSASVHGALVGTIQKIALAEAEVTPMPNGVVSDYVPLQPFAEWASGAAAPNSQRISDFVVAEILQREYPLISANPSGAQVSLQGLWLLDYEQISTTDEYLEYIARDSLTTQPVQAPAAELPLAQTLDYLGYTLAAHAGWSGNRLTSGVQLESAGALHLPANTREEFESRLNSLWSIVDTLTVPDIPADELRDELKGRQPRTIGKLEHWLQKHVDAEQLPRIEEALSTVRTVGRLRAAGAHPAGSARIDGLRAQRRLGLPEFLSDWSSALDIVKFQLAWAFTVVRTEVQAATS